MEWIVIADGSGANVFKLSQVKALELVKAYTNPLGRLRNKAMSRDKPGISRAKRAGSSPHNLSKEKSPHEEGLEQFARKLAKSFVSDLKRIPDLQLRTVAESRLAGKIRGFLNKSVVSPRVIWVMKDLEKVPKKRWPQMIGIQSKTKTAALTSRFPI